MVMVPADPVLGRRRPGPNIIPIGASGPGAAVPGGGMTLDALMQRQAALAKQQPQAPENMQSPWQGAGFVGQSLMHGLQEGRAERQATDARAALAQAMTQVNPETGEYSPEAMATIAGLMPEQALKISADLVNARREDKRSERTHGWDVEGRQAEFTHADEAAERQRLREEQQHLRDRGEELSDAQLQRKQVLDDAARARGEKVGDVAEQRTYEESQKAAEPAQAAAKIGAETEARRTEALRLGLKEGSDEFNNYVATGGSPQHVKTETEQLSEKVAARQVEAEKLGLKPGSQEYKDYTLTGQLNKMPASELDTITETDDKVHATDQYIQEMQSLLTPGADGQSVNDKAFSGIGADTRTSLARNDPTGLLADKERGLATTKLKNIIGSEAISSLRAIFGSNPTEGERQVLMDMNASVDKSPAERKDIIERAVRLAKDRLLVLQSRSQQLRSGTYAQPSGGGSGDPDLDALLKKYQ